MVRSYIPPLLRSVSGVGFLLAVVLSFCQLVAAAPSFDCAKASAPIEKLICGSQELGDLDSAVAQAYSRKRRSLGASETGVLLQQQRKWLARRNAECHVPTHGGEPAPEAIRQATSCLIKFYRDRLAELSAATDVPVHSIVLPSRRYHYALVMSENDKICRPLAALYSSWLAQFQQQVADNDALQDHDAPWIAVSPWWESDHEDQLRALGFMPIKGESSPHVVDGLGYTFTLVDLFGTGQRQWVGVADHSPNEAQAPRTDFVFLKPNLKVDPDAFGSTAPPEADIDDVYRRTLPEARYPIWFSRGYGYLLTKWPGFTQKYNDWAAGGNEMPAINWAIWGLYKRNSKYFALLRSWTGYHIPNFPYNQVVLQKFERPNLIDDVCYLSLEADQK